LGVIFFGTLYIGSSYANIARWLAIRPNTVARKPEPKLLKFLRKGSKALEILDREFKDVLTAKPYNIVAFYKMKTITRFRLS